MDNKDVAKLFDELSKLMELNGENPFKIRSYQSAYQTIRGLDDSILNMSAESIEQIKGIGKATSSKIEEIKITNSFNTLNNIRSKVPIGVREMLSIKGLGVKKIKAFWKELDLITPEDVLAAGLENKLIVIKGISEKTQLKILDQLRLFIDSRGKKLGAEAQSLSKKLIDSLNATFPTFTIIEAGELKGNAPVVDKIEIVTDIPGEALKTYLMKTISSKIEIIDDNTFSFFDEILFVIYLCSKDALMKNAFVKSSSDDFINYLESICNIPNFDDEEHWMKTKGWTYLVPELRFDVENFKLAQEKYEFDLIEEKDIRGLVHFHTKYSDGLNSLDEMIEEAIAKGYEYAVVTDHSQSAFYASGLKENEIFKQFEEIDRVQLKYPNIKIFKSIESDILNNGSLDYKDEVLEQFDLVIASIHSNLGMDEKKAMKRLLTAIENPYTHILGHMTGRLLLMRNGYPIDHKTIIDACALNNVAIELNANPRRMDIDYQWIRYAMDRNVMISINPDAHFIAGIDDIKYGVQVARRGGLSKALCLNALPADQFMDRLKKN